MPIFPKVFFGFLVFMMLLSVVLSYDGIARIKRQNGWENWYHNQEYHRNDSTFMVITNRTVVFIDSTFGKIVCWASLFIIPMGCGFLIFRFERIYLGLTLLFLCAIYYGWIGVFLWIFDRFVPRIMM
jgi:hypothetical protein